MALTSNCDLYLAVHEEGINRVIMHVMRQRPSLFNYATADIAQNDELWCSGVDVTKDVLKYNNPIFTILNPIPVLGADSPPVGLNFCVQLTRGELDFHPGNAISLPSKLNPPLKDQRFSLHFIICGAIGCPSDAEVDRIQPRPPQKDPDEPPGPPVILEGELNCFCLDVFAVGHLERVLIAGKEFLIGRIDDMDIVDIRPEALELNVICYLKTMVNVLLRQKLFIEMEKLFFDFPLFDLATITLSPTPDPPIPNNPAVEENQFKLFFDMKVSP